MSAASQQAIYAARSEAMARKGTQAADAATVNWSDGAAGRAATIASAMMALSPAADAATETDNVSDTNTASVPALVTQAADAARAAQDALTLTQTQLAGLPEHIAAPALAIAQDTLTLALGNLALAEANAELEAERSAKIADATARAANLPAEYKAAALTAMLAAIEAEYAPAPDESEAVDEAPAQAPDESTSGRKQPSANTLAKNAASAANPELMARAAALVDAWRGSANDADCKAHKLAGTRYAGLVCFATDSAGVANYADFDVVARAVLAELASRNYPAGGKSTITAPWLTRTGAHAVDGPKAKDWFGACFISGANIALYADGRFRIARTGTPNVRFIATDASARAIFNGAAAQSTSAATTAPQTSASAPQAPQAPIPPSAPQTSASVVTALAQCQHCGARNVDGRAQCHYCGAADWSG